MELTFAIGPYLSNTLRTVMTRMMRVKLMAIAVGMLPAGLKTFFAALSRQPAREKRTI